MTRKFTSSNRSCESHGTCFFLAAAMVFLAGCGIGSERKSPLSVKVETLQREKAETTGDLEQCRVENEQLQQQVKALTALPGDRGENPYKLTSVRISRFTGFYDDDKDGRREKLLVYLQPIDENGDIFKAAGTVSVQLWNLDDPNNGQALLGRWQVSPAELRKHWIAALVSEYRIPLDVSLTPGLLARPLTVKVTFTDYLTGDLFHDQYAIQPRPR